MHGIKKILSTFERASGLKINLEKSALVFSRNVPSHTRAELAFILGLVVQDKHDKYLGLPTAIGRSKREVFEGIKERFLEENQWVGCYALISSRPGGSYQISASSNTIICHVLFRDPGQSSQGT
ncbi:UNVERIFIED_CONTAM: hypothetical protein Slati_2911300 [Sesamum latifolium]|uniref:Reverse transcriptase n=1 Tax=Sesamum latifolium TaxID=2727402 RepID=A0AAW2VGG9_9LAMI